MQLNVLPTIMPSRQWPSCCCGNILGCHCVVCCCRVSFNQHVISGRKNEAGYGTQDEKCPSFK